MSDAKKMGRPFSENPKSTKITLRIDKNDTEILDNYCGKKKISRSDGIREGIHRLK